MEDIFELEEPIIDTISLLTKPQLPWLNELNPEQRIAVETTDGPVLVLSGAGTGKTKVLTTRLAYALAQHKAQPWECLVVTFTNRAAREMKERVHNLIGEMADSVWLGTFHGVCVKILRKYAELVGLKTNFTILGDDDQKRLIKQILEQESIDIKKYQPQDVLGVIQRWKDKNIKADAVGKDPRENITAMVYQKYQNRLLELNCVDFGDILLYTLDILMKHKDILEKYQNQFKYIMVDEYQDTNVTQYLFLRLLAQKHKNICCVGDDDQSIYSWRGAEVENILSFEKDFTNAITIRLERNYRSTANILAAASNLINNNTGRLGKTLKVAENSPAAQVENHKVKVVSNYNGKDEAEYVIDEIDAALRNGFEYSQIAILVRTASQTREFEDKFLAESIPYKIIGGLRFYERAEIRDALAYFRVILQKDDDLALERIINKPTRGVGDKALETFQDIARQKYISLYDAVEFALNEDLVKSKAKTGLEELFKNFAKWRKEVEIMNAGDLAHLILEESGYINSLKNTDKNKVENEGRIENLNELVNVMSNEEEHANFYDFMEHVSLVMDTENTTETNSVTIMTLHSAKGLEFDIVFLPGWEEGLFPHQRAIDEGGLEEERRLAYVAITRAKKLLYILTALNRFIYGQSQNNIPSRFLNELPQQHIEICNNCKFFSAPTEYKPTYIPNKGSKFSSPLREEAEDTDYSYEPDYSDNENLIGAKVYHQTFGYGTIKKIEGTKLGIYFFKNGYKNVISNYVKLV